MRPNRVGKAAGLTAADGTRLKKRMEGMRQSIEALNAFEQVTGEKCENSETCLKAFNQARQLIETFFGDDSTPEPQAEQ